MQILQSLTLIDIDGDENGAREAMARRRLFASFDQIESIETKVIRVVSRESPKFGSPVASAQGGKTNRGFIRRQSSGAIV